MKIATATKLKLAFGAIVVTGAVTAFVIQQQIQAKLRGENESLQQQIAQLQAAYAGLSNRITTIGEANQLPAEQYTELLKLRGEVGVLRRQLDDSAQEIRALQSAGVRVSSLNTNSPAPQLHIKARFLTMPSDVLAGLGGLTRFNGILNRDTASDVLQEVESRNGVEILAEPEFIQTSGRQTEMRATQVISVITNFCLQETNGISGIVPQVTPVEKGPVIDVTPHVLSDGYTIELPTIASVIDFLGYAPSTNTTTAYTAAGEKVDVPTVSPQFRVQQSTNSVNLLDGQTLVFALKDEHVPTDAALMELNGSKSNLLDRQTLVFITANIIDQAGNLVHEDAGNYTNTPPPANNQ